MSARVSSLVFLALSGAAAAQCPSGGLAAHDRCWYLSEVGKSCSATCSAHGLSMNHFVAPAESPMVPQLLGRSPTTKQHSWGRLECYVGQGDRYHTAKPVPDGNSDDKGEPGDWAVSICRLACPCVGGAAAAQAAAAIDNAPYPECMQKNSVLRHAGAHAIFVDVSSFGSVGCWQNDCKNSDKFNAEDKGICARACHSIEECTHWTHGEQEGAMKCFFRKSDAGRETAEGWHAAPKTCAPPAVPDSAMAKAASEVLRACDAGKNEGCPDMAKAITTWKFAIKHLKKGAEGKVDANTLQYITQVASDTDAFASQMSEENFPIIVGNNRQVFNVLDAWMSSQPAYKADTTDKSLPNVMHGKLCGPNSCFEL